MKDSISTVIVDDEPLARDTIALLLKHEIDIEVVGSYGDGDSALQGILQVRPRLVFLDIQMPGKSGFQVVEALQEQLSAEAMPFIVFVTAYDQYALQAFDCHALDYLLKPYKDRRFHQSLDRARAEIEKNRSGVFANQLQNLLLDLNSAKAIRREPDRLALRVDGRIAFVAPADILYLEASDHYVCVHACDQTYLCRDSLSRLAGFLDDQFVRIHRSILVHRRHVAELRQVARDEYEIRLRNGKQLPISRRRLKEVKSALGV